MIMLKVLSHCPAGRSLPKEYHLIQTLGLHAPNEPLDERGSIGSTIGKGQPPDAHGLVQPAVQVAAIAAPLVIALHGDVPAVLAEDAVVVVDEEARSSAPGGCLTDLLLHPGKRWIDRDVDVHDPSGADLHDDEDVDDGEEGGVLGEKVASPELFGMVADKGAPGLIPTGCVPARNHVTTYGARGMLDAELGGQFLGDLVFAPFGVVSRDTLNEVDVLSGNAGSARLAGTRTTTPQDLEALSIPADYGSGSHDNERAGPIWPESSEDDPEEAVLGAKRGPLPNPLADGELLA